MQEDHQHDHRQGTAQKDVLTDQRDRRVDVIGLVVDLGQLQTTRLEQPPVDLPVGLPQPLHHLQHIGSGLADAVDRDTRFPEPPNHPGGFLEPQLNFGHIPYVDRHPVLHDQQLVLDLLGTAELSKRPDDPAAFAFGEVAGRSVLVLAPQHAEHVGDRDLP